MQAKPPMGSQAPIDPALSITPENVEIAPAVIPIVTVKPFIEAEPQTYSAKQNSQGCPSD